MAFNDIAEKYNVIHANYYPDGSYFTLCAKNYDMIYNFSLIYDD